jgi:hypothetical protein
MGVRGKGVERFVENSGVVENVLRASKERGS